MRLSSFAGIALTFPIAGELACTSVNRAEALEEPRLRTQRTDFRFDQYEAQLLVHSMRHPTDLR